MSELLARLAQVAARPRLLVACDLDGTLAPIVPDPADARADPAALAALHRLAGRRDTRVAIISGRTRADLLRIVGPPGALLLIGSHGVEDGSGAPLKLDPPASTQRDRLAAELEALARSAAGCRVEVKPASVALHYRRASPDDARRVLHEAPLRPAAAHAVRVLHGHCVIEFAFVCVSKGAALQRLRSEFGSANVLFVGDDASDEDAFAVLREDDLGIKVGTGPTRATLQVDGPADVSALLARLADLRTARTDTVPTVQRPRPNAE